VTRRQAPTRGWVLTSALGTPIPYGWELDGDELTITTAIEARWPRLAAAPQPPLRPLLPRGYAGFTEATTPRHLILPATTSVPLVVKLADSPHRPSAFVMGARDSFTVLEGASARSYLEVLLAPLGAYRLLGVPMDELSGQLVDLVDVLGPEGRHLGERLRAAPSWGQRFALLDRFLLRRLEAGPRPTPEVAWAWRRLTATGGAVPIAQLAGEVGWSHKHLIAKFRHQVGLRPKTAARLVRFEGVLGRLDERQGLDWGLVARQAGYADQAHLIRDFRQFTGTTPTAYVARVLPADPPASNRSIPFQTPWPPPSSLAGGNVRLESEDGTRPGGQGGLGDRRQLSHWQGNRVGVRR
jgi:AraC-like DNA-binding protein